MPTASPCTFAAWTPGDSSDRTACEHSRRSTPSVPSAGTTSQTPPLSSWYPRRRTPRPQTSQRSRYGSSWAAFRHRETRKGRGRTVDRRRGWAMMLALETGARVTSLASVRREDVHVDDPNGPWIYFATTKFDKPYELPLTRAGAIACRHLLVGEGPASRCRSRPVPPLGPPSRVDGRTTPDVAPPTAPPLLTQGRQDGGTGRGPRGLAEGDEPFRSSGSSPGTTPRAGTRCGR